MPSVIYKLLGEKKIKEIYEKRLIKSEESKRIVEEIIKEWDKHMNDINKQADIFFEKTKEIKEKQDYSNIFRAVFEIFAEFMRKSLELEEKASKNLH